MDLIWIYEMFSGQEHLIKEKKKKKSKKPSWFL